MFFSQLSLAAGTLAGLPPTGLSSGLSGAAVWSPLLFVGVVCGCLAIVWALGDSHVVLSRQKDGPLRPMWT